MLIDSGHSRWIIATAGLAVAAVGGHAFLNRMTPGGLTGGSAVGLWYGIAGTLLMIFAGLLAAHRRFPAWYWLGKRSVWLKGHIWLGLLSLPVLLCHSNYRWGGTLERILWVVFGLVIISGVFGLVVQQVIPRLLTVRVPMEAPYGQLPYLCSMLSRRADILVEAIEMVVEFHTGRSGSLSDLDTEVQQFHVETIRPFLQHPSPAWSVLARPLGAEAKFLELRKKLGVRNIGDSQIELDTAVKSLQAGLADPSLKDLRTKADAAVGRVRMLLNTEPKEPLNELIKLAFNDLKACESQADVGDPVARLRRILQDHWLDQLNDLCDERRQYRTQERLYLALHLWLMVHIPLSIALLILGLAHAFTATIFY